jgi:hypothetical protein
MQRYTAVFMLTASYLMLYQSVTAFISWLLVYLHIMAAKDVAKLVKQSAILGPIGVAIAIGVIAVAGTAASGVIAQFSKETRTTQDWSYTIETRRDFARSMQDARYYATEYE